jgi:hypothetical protein
VTAAASAHDQNVKRNGEPPGRRPKGDQDMSDEIRAKDDENEDTEGNIHRAKGPAAVETDDTEGNVHRAKGPAAVETDDTEGNVHRAK